MSLAQHKSSKTGVLPKICDLKVLNLFGSLSSEHWGAFWDFIYCSAELLVEEGMGNASLSIFPPIDLFPACLGNEVIMILPHDNFLLKRDCYFFSCFTIFTLQIMLDNYKD